MYADRFGLGLTPLVLILIAASLYRTADVAAAAGSDGGPRPAVRGLAGCPRRPIG
jgi:hypothetical protein